MSKKNKKPEGEKNNKTPEAKKFSPVVKKLTFDQWAKLKAVISTSLGAVVALKINNNQQMSESEFDTVISDYRNQKSFNV